MVKGTFRREVDDYRGLELRRAGLESPAWQEAVLERPTEWEEMKMV